MSLKGLYGAVIVAAVIVCGACGDDDSGAAIADARVTTADAAVAAADAAPNAADASAAQLATLSGNVTRSVAPTAGGVGNLFIALFEQDPVTSMNPPAPVGQVLIENADMSGDGAAIAYEIPNVALRADPYFIVAFLDDNGTAAMDPASAGPDMGDLVSLSGLASPSVVINQAGVVQQDIDLNLAMPF